jgi:raffinose/stachyose/melibiose transport system permease protein
MRGRLGVISLFLIPSLLLYTVFVIYPIFFSAYLSLTSWKGIGPKEWIGMDNFIYIFTSNDFHVSIKNTMLVTFLSILIQVPAGLIIAYLLFRTKNSVYKVYRGVYFLPVVIASTAIATMFRIILNNDIGVFDTILKVIGLGKFSRPWLSDSGAVIYSVIFVQIWQFIGTFVIIFLAAFQSIDPEIFESAVIDGANSTQQFFLIACPLISEVIKTAIILCFTGSMKSFDIPFIMTAGGPGYASSYLGNYMYKSVFGVGRFGQGAAVTIVILAISFVFTALFNKLTMEKGR